MNLLIPRLILLSLGINLLFCSFVIASTIVYCSEGSPKLFNPQLAVDGTTIMATEGTIYGQLVARREGDLKLIPRIAKKWKISKNNLQYTFYIKKNIKFHKTSYFTPTRDLNVNDVIWSINRMRLDSHPYNDVNGGQYAIFNSLGLKSNISDIVKIDNHTVRFVLKYPDSTFLTNMATGVMSVLSKEYADKLVKLNKKEQIDLKPIGTGPFKFKKYVKDTSIVYISHKDYFLGAPKSKKLVFSITPNSNVRFQKLKTKECHISVDPSPVDIPNITKHKNINLIEVEGMNVGFLSLNMRKKPLNILKVRQAILLALNKENYIKLIYKNMASIANNLVPKTILNFNKNEKSNLPEIDKAKELLKEAGFPKGFDITLWTLPVSRPYNPNGKKMGELMMEDLKKINIKVKLVSYKWATFLEKAMKREHEIIQLGWSSANGDPDNFYGMLLTCAADKNGVNYSGWCNKKYDELIYKAKKNLNKNLRFKYYLKAQNIINSELPLLPIAYAKIFRAVRKEVKGYKFNALSIERFENVYLQ